MAGSLVARVGMCAVVAACLAADVVRADTEVVTHAVGDYKKDNGSGYCCATCDDLPNAVADAAAFLAGGAFATIYDQVQSYTNQAVDGRDFTDDSQYAWGDDEVDPYGTDYADVVFFSGGGGWSNTYTYGFLVMGDDNAGESCYPRLGDDDSAARHAELGNGGTGEEADVLVMFACNNPQYEVWSADGYHDTSHASGQFNMMNGFHGDVWEVTGYQADLQNYATDATYNAVGDAWLDRMYDPRGSGGDDNCPLVLGWGANASEVNDYYANAGWLDFHDTGSRAMTGPRAYYLCGCDPVDGVALPSC